VGLASYYAQKYHGRKTASGEKYNMNEMTAAHREYPFGTRVRVKNLQNGSSVVVRINDRGPFIRKRVIDLSLAAARKLDMIRAGVVKVEVLPVTNDKSSIAGVERLP
jgi:rare lipoprotein A